jgi:hypothetical protein
MLYDTARRYQSIDHPISGGEVVSAEIMLQAVAKGSEI